MRRLLGRKADPCELRAKGVKFSLLVPPWRGREEVGRPLVPLAEGRGREGRELSSEAAQFRDCLNL